MKYLLVMLMMFSGAVHAIDSVPDEVLFASYRITITTTTEKIIGVDEHGDPVTAEFPQTSLCSATAMDARHLLGAGHCGTHKGTFTCDLFDTKTGHFNHSIPMKCLTFDEKLDLALFEVDEDLPHFHKPEFADAVVGHAAVVIGAPHGWSPYHCAVGIVAALQSEPEAGNIEIAASSWHGASGGGVYDDKFNFIGVLVAGAEATVLVVPSATVKTFLENYRKSLIVEVKVPSNQKKVEGEKPKAWK